MECMMYYPMTSHLRSGYYVVHLDDFSIVHKSIHSSLQSSIMHLVDIC